MDDRLLRITLTVNAVTTAAAAVGVIALADVLATPLGIPAPVLVAVGLGLLPWATLLWWTRSRDVLLRRDVRVAVVGDVAWVAGSALVLALPSGLTSAGQWVVGLVALAVLDFAVLQVVGLRRLAGSVRRSPTGPRPAAR